MNRRKVQVTGLNARPGSDILVFLPVRLFTFGDYLSSPEVAMYRYQYCFNATLDLTRVPSVTVVAYCKRIAWYIKKRKLRNSLRLHVMM